MSLNDNWMQLQNLNYRTACMAENTAQQTSSITALGSPFITKYQISFMVLFVKHNHDRISQIAFMHQVQHRTVKLRQFIMYI